MRKYTTEKVCPVCGRSFLTRDPRTVHCSHACGMQNKQVLVDQQCVHCGQVFHASRQTNRYCGKACEVADRKPRRTADERFWSKVRKAESDDCWEWIASTKFFGYGQFNYKGTMQSAHRVAYELTNGVIPDGQEVCHTCDNPPCCNPNHLFLGTQKDNMQDMVRKQRNMAHTHPERQARGERHFSHTKPDRVCRGERQGPAKLTDEAVREIRTLHAEGKSKGSLARRFNVSRTTIYRVLKGTHWQHVE